ncbi:anthranilate phosphoribosyltransferase [Candidatus Uabimicrobium sp. HlEnr_7]|uniref:anthranilate phosphoribosyltransferase n=1 Tax=Candidatus Uabimicrobium helgolandensis TaxID=3095367 RepID=UPI003557E6A4
MKVLLDQLLVNKTISRSQACQVLKDIAQNKYNDHLVAAFLTVFRMRHITVEELGGFRDAMRELCIPVDLKAYSPIDLCGTGGDGKNTFNISTLTAFVVAGSGIKVAKHGNYGASSRCGSSNVLESLGIKFTNDITQLQQLIEEAGFCYLHGPMFHPAMKNVAPVRKNLGIRTFFNLLGPLVSPAFPKKQMIGVVNLEVARLYSYLLQNEDIDYVIVHSLDGYDEISLTGAFKKIDKRGEQIISPQDCGFEQVNAEDLYGGDSIEESAAILMKILKGKGTAAQNQTIIANATFAIHCAFPQKSLDECKHQATESLKSGKALQVLTKIIAISKTMKD